MKIRVWMGVAAVAACGVVVGLALQGRAESPSAPQAKTGALTERLLLGVEKVSCGSCEVRIRETLEARPGVRAVAVNLAQKTVTVEYVAGRDDPRSLAEAVTRLGYPARFLAAGGGVAPVVQPGTSRPRGGCGGSCCAGG